MREYVLLAVVAVFFLVGMGAMYEVESVLTYIAGFGCCIGAAYIGKDVLS